MTRRRLVFLHALLGFAIAACGRNDDQRSEVISLQDQGRYVEALESLGRLVTENPDDPELNYRYGLSLLADDQFGMAVWPLRRASESPQFAVLSGLELAWAAYQNGTHDDAVMAASRVLEIEPDNLSALLVRGKSHLRANREEEALADFARMQEIDPDVPDIWMSRAMALMRLGRLEEAGDQLQRIRDEVQSDARSADPLACTLLAVFAHESGDDARAEANFEECLESFPTAQVVVQRAVEFYDDTDRRERGSEIYREVLAREPQRIDVQLALAERLRKSGNPDQAEKILRRATQALPGPGPWLSLAWHFEEMEDPENAHIAMASAFDLLTVVPENLRFAYADILIRASRYDLAVEQLKRLDWPGYTTLIHGRIALERGDYREALERLERGVAYWPDNPGLRKLVGEAAEQLGLFDRAIAEYREAVRTQDPSTDAGLDLARLYEALGNLQAAYTSVAMHQQIHPNDIEALRLGISLAARGGLAGAVEAQIDQLVQLGHPAEAVAARAELAAKTRGPDAAAEIIRAAGLNLTDPAHGAALSVLARALVSAGRPDEAQEIALTSVQSNPDDPSALATWGETLELGNPDRATRAYQKALSISDVTLEAARGLARIAERDGRNTEALAQWDLALSADPKDEEAAWGAIRIANAAGDLEEVERRLRARLRANPRDGAAASQLQTIRLEGNPDEARQLGRRAARLGVLAAKSAKQDLATESPRS